MTAPAFVEGRVAGQDGLSLYYREYGEAGAPGVPVLCLAGLTRNSVDFHATAARLAGRRRVLCLDYRGRGRSAYDPDPTHYVPTWYINDIGQLLAATGCHRVVVLGTSLGGILAMGLGAARPTALAGVILNDIGPELDPLGIARIAGYVGQPVDLPDLGAAVGFLKTRFQAAYPDFSDEDWAQEAQIGFRRTDSGRFELDYDPKVGEALRSPDNQPRDLWPLFRSLSRLPALAIRGDLSDLLSEATFRRMAEVHPGLRQVSVPNRGHVPHLTEPECVAAIDAFLENVDHDSGHAPAGH